MTLAPLLYLVFAGYLLITTIFIIAENRRPSDTFAWMLVFAALPGVGIVLYLLFGRKLFGQTTRLMRQEAMARLKPAIDGMEQEHEEGLRQLAASCDHDELIARLVAHNSRMPVTTRNDVKLLRDAPEAYGSLIKDIKAARQSIHLQYFSWGSDELGEGLKEALSAKVKEGVVVRILYDPLGSLTMLKRRYLREMREAGINMQPVSRLWRVHTISYRNHRKIAVIDGLIGHTGGLNIGQEHLEPPEGFDQWRDTNVRMEGSIVAPLQAVFIVDWKNATGENLFQHDPSEVRLFPDLPEHLADANVPAQLSLSGPDSRWAAIRQLYFAMITNAREKVYMVSPFFILDDSITEALKTAALQGVDVRIMISERGTGQYLPYWAANTYLEEISRAGAKILLYRTGYLHAKTMTMDGRICTVGSANIDIRSFSINYELNAIFYDEALTRELDDDFQRDAAHCVEFTAKEYRERGALIRFRDSIARLFSPLM